MRLGQLILMLSSDSDGEVVAAARAIDRHLKSINKDWHWLADRLNDDPLRSSFTAPRPAPSAHKTWSGFERAYADGGTVRDVPLETAVRYCLNNTYRMQRRHREFIAAMQTAYKVHGGTLAGKLTTAQEKYLRDLYYKYGGT